MSCIISELSSSELAPSMGGSLKATSAPRTHCSSKRVSCLTYAVNRSAPSVTRASSSSWAATVFSSHSPHSSPAAPRASAEASSSSNASVCNRCPIITKLVSPTASLASARASSRAPANCRVSRKPGHSSKWTKPLARTTPAQASLRRTASNALSRSGRAVRKATLRKPSCFRCALGGGKSVSPPADAAGKRVAACGGSAGWQSTTSGGTEPRSHSSNRALGARRCSSAPTARSAGSDSRSDLLRTSRSAAASCRSKQMRSSCGAAAGASAAGAEQTARCRPAVLGAPAAPIRRAMLKPSITVSTASTRRASQNCGSSSVCRTGSGSAIPVVSSSR
mmetsp:Transcript_3740/g.9769  ORF Transcript_3740/g.9769 Transcript_3740/m.9769 type:complete len:336 (+) Transcript_3740:815-1822(+)